eukprot:TRINITY_DN8394_c0_g1_i3.p1 TRINITY_DN8394_c0_g1~~TRINITY_DN8394_c0_g1_i3.p1  ORF type:complete len:583 (+),score=96.87 TRINITY_DN8394_c0_g1_i3:51-1799(+)
MCIRDRYQRRVRVDCQIMSEVVIATAVVDGTSVVSVTETPPAKVEAKKKDKRLMSSSDEEEDDDDTKAYALTFRYRDVTKRLTFYKPPKRLCEDHTDWAEVFDATLDTLDRSFKKKISQDLNGVAQYINGPVIPLSVVIKSPKRYSHCNLDLILEDDSPLIKDIEVPVEGDLAANPTWRQTEFIQASFSKVQKILDEPALSAYECVFDQHEIDYDALLELNETDLQEMGMPLGARKKLLTKIQSEIVQRNNTKKKQAIKKRKMGPYTWKEAHSQLCLPRFIPITLQPIDFSRLQKSKFKDDYCSFLSHHIRHFGYAYVKLPQEMLTKLNDYKKMWLKFFERPKKEMLKYQLPSGMYGGYYDQEDRHMFHVAPFMLGSSPPWPQEPSDFQFKAVEMFRMLENIAKTCLTALAHALNIDPELFLDFCEERFFPRHLGSSCRVCKYKKQERNSGIICIEHTDTTILSVGPVSEIPELQFYNRATREWVYAESEVDNSHVIIFAGRMLARLTAGYYQPTFHRVYRRCGEERLSLPFFLRNRGEAVIDSVKIIENSNLRHTWEVPKFLRRRETYEEWMNRQDKILVH